MYVKRIAEDMTLRVLSEEDLVIEYHRDILFYASVNYIQRID